MNIVIDQGNTFSKIALFENNMLLSSYVLKEPDMTDIQSLLTEYKPYYGILGSVGNIQADVLVFLKEHLKQFFIPDKNTLLPVKINYRTPETLGIDRLAGVIGAQEKAPGKNILVIDAGTAVTYDFLDSSGEYPGGNISPGIQMRFKALNAYTQQLPLINELGDLPEIGYNTETAIRSGVINGIIYEMDTYINKYKQSFPDLFVFLTGGDSIHFEGKLKNSIFAENNLVLEGLNRILNYNVKA